MALTITCQAQDGTRSISLLAPPYSITWDGVIRGEAAFTDAGERKNRNHEFTTDADRKLRSMGWAQMIDETTVDLLNTAYTALSDIICQPQWVLVLNDGGASSTNRYYDCYAVTSVPNFTSMVPLRAFHRYNIRFEAMPFARGDVVVLPRNLIKDPLMCEDFNNDNIPNAFVNADENTAPEHTNSIDLTFAGAKINVTTGGALNGSAGQVGVNFAVVAGQSYSYRAGYKTSAALTNCKVQIFLQYNDEAGTRQYLKNDNTPSAAEAELTLLNQTAPAGATGANLYWRVTGTASNMVGALWLKEPMAVLGATLPVGKNGGTLFYCSELTETPGTMVIRNLPGDVPATAELLFIGQATTDTSGGRCLIYAGLTAVSENDQYGPFVIKDTTNPVANADCIGGVYGGSAGTYYTFANRPQCAYILLARTFTTDTAPTTKTRSFIQAVSLDLPGWYTGASIKPYWYSGGSAWTVNSYGVFESPMRGVSPWRNISDSFWPQYSGTVDRIDWNAFMPLDQYFRADVVPPTTGGQYIHVISDSSSMTPNNPGFSVAYQTSIKDDYTGAYFAFSSPHDGNPLTLVPGPGKNLMMLLCTVHGISGAYDKKAGGLMLIRYTPRYL